MLLARVGLWFSVVRRTTLRATAWAILTMFGVNAAPFVVGLVVYTTVGEQASWLAFQLFGTCPPVTLWTLCFNDGNFRSHGGAVQTWERLSAGLLGVGFYAAAPRLLLRSIHKRVPRVTG